MLKLEAKKREIIGKKVKVLRKQGLLPAVLYGPKVKSLALEIDSKEFDKVYKEAGESSLISLELNSPKNSSGQAKKFPVLIHELRKDPLTGTTLHVDFYQPILTEEVEATVPLVFEGEAPAVKELGGTLVKEIQEIEVKALPQELPHEIKVNVDKLKSFEDEILIKDLELPEKVKIDRKPDEIVALVTRPEKVEEELEKPVEEKPVEEKVEEVEEVEGEKKKEKKKEEKKEKEEKTEEPKNEKK